MFYKKDSGTGAFLWTLRKFQEHIFYRAPGDCSFFLTHVLRLCFRRLQFFERDTLLFFTNVLHTLLIKFFITSSLFDMHIPFRGFQTFGVYSPIRAMVEKMDGVCFLKVNNFSKNNQMLKIYFVSLFIGYI